MAIMRSYLKALWMLMAVVMLSAVTQILADDGKKDFTGYQVYRIQLSKQSQSDAIIKFVTDHGDDDLSFWKGPHLNKPTDVLVSPSKITEFKEFLKTNDIVGSANIEDLQKMIDDSSKPTGSRAEKVPGQMTWDDWYTYDEIMLWLKEVHKEYPELTSLTTIGTTHEGRDLVIITITAQNERAKEGALIDAGMHAREWITETTVTYIINELTKNHEKYEEFLANTTFYIFPVVNPDGYEYSQTRDRTWRKNRTPTSEPKCPGVDINRNFPFGWSEPASGSSRECDQTYKGPSACSEKECQAYTAFVLSHPDIKTHINLHSYGQWWTYPYSHIKRLPDNDKEFSKIVKSVTSALKSVHGTEYQYGSGAIILNNPVAGVIDDWTFEEGKVSYTYTVELRDRTGFFLPLSEILPTAEETWLGIQYAVTRGSFNGSFDTTDDDDKSSGMSPRITFLPAILSFLVLKQSISS